MAWDLGGAGERGEGTVVFFLSQTAQENAILKVLANLKMGAFFFSLVFNFSVTVLHSLHFDPRNRILIRLCRM